MSSWFIVSSLRTVFDEVRLSFVFAAQNWFDSLLAILGDFLSNSSSDANVPGAILRFDALES